MLPFQTCASDNCLACLLSIDSYHSDLPKLIAILYVELDHLCM